ncbi:MAG: transposase [Bacteroidota bacterium]
MTIKLVIGIDTSKAKIDAWFKLLGADEQKHLCLLNSKIGFSKLDRTIRSFKVLPDEVFVCIEHTGYYGYKFFQHCKAKGYYCIEVSPLKIKRSAGVVRGKSDEDDSLMIAEFALRHLDELFSEIDLAQDLLKLKTMLSQRNQLIKYQLGIENHNKLIISTLPKKEIKQTVKQNNRIFSYFQKQINLTEARIYDLVFNDQDLKNNFKLLNSIVGVGPWTALYVILYTRNFMRIICPRRFACFAGIAPFKHESGSSIKGKPRVSHLANKKMKSLLQMSAMSAVTHDPELKAFYNRKIEEGKSKMSVLNAVRNKLVHRMFAVIRRQSAYFVKPVFEKKPKA